MGIAPGQGGMLSSLGGQVGGMNNSSMAGADTELTWNLKCPSHSSYQTNGTKGKNCFWYGRDGTKKKIDKFGLQIYPNLTLEIHDDDERKMKVYLQLIKPTEYEEVTIEWEVIVKQD